MKLNDLEKEQMKREREEKRDKIQERIAISLEEIAFALSEMRNHGIIAYTK